MWAHGFSGFMPGSPSPVWSGPGVVQCIRVECMSYHSPPSSWETEWMRQEEGMAPILL